MQAEQKLLRMLESQEAAAVNYQASIAKAQDKANDYYFGKPFGNEQADMSQHVTRDVAITVDAITPDLIKLFLSGDRVVEFEPSAEADEDFADLATDYCNAVFFKDNDGFTVLLDLVKTGLIEKIGVGKVYWDGAPRRKRHQFSGLTEDQLVMLNEEKNVEIIEHTEEEDGTHKITLIRSLAQGRVRIESLPNKEFLISEAAKTLGSAEYVAHKVKKKGSEIVAMGFKKSDLDKLTDIDSADDTDEDAANEELDPLHKSYWLLEEYILTDYDNDGITETRKITRVGKEIIENIEVDEHPFFDFCPNRTPHKVIGQSAADAAMDIQYTKSTLVRQTHDNLYMSNRPRIEVPEHAIDGNTISDLLTMVPGGIVRTKNAGGINPLVVPFTAGHSFEMLGYWDEERQNRTGVTPYNQGLDADSLNKTARGIQMIQDKGMGKIDLIARNLANAMGVCFKKVLRLVVQHQNQERTVRLRGEWTPIDPRFWNAEMSFQINVGLGTGDKGKRIDARLMLMDIQREGKAEGIVGYSEIYNNIKGLVRDVELGEVGKYFISPEDVEKAKEGQPEPVDPEVEAQKAELELKTQEMQMKIQIEQAKIESNAALKREQMEIEAQLKREQMMIEARLKIMEGGDSNISPVQMGGDVG